MWRARAPHVQIATSLQGARTSMATPAVGGLGTIGHRVRSRHLALSNLGGGLRQHREGSPRHRSRRLEDRAASLFTATIVLESAYRRGADRAVCRPRRSGARSSAGLPHLVAVRTAGATAARPRRRGAARVGDSSTGPNSPRCHGRRTTIAASLSSGRPCLLAGRRDPGGPRGVRGDREGLDGTRAGTPRRAEWLDGDDRGTVVTQLTFTSRRDGWVVSSRGHRSARRASVIRPIRSLWLAGPRLLALGVAGEKPGAVRPSPPAGGSRPADRRGGRRLRVVDYVPLCAPYFPGRPCLSGRRRCARARARRAAIDVRAAFACAGAVGVVDETSTQPGCPSTYRSRSGSETLAAGTLPAWGRRAPLATIWPCSRGGAWGRRDDESTRRVRSTSEVSMPSSSIPPLPTCLLRGQIPLRVERAVICPVPTPGRHFSPRMSSDACHRRADVDRWGRRE